jgi:WD40 repeat protein
MAKKAVLLMIAVGLTVGTIVAQPNLVYRLYGHQGEVIFDISPSGEWLITVDSEYTKAWNLLTGKVEVPDNRAGYVNSVCFLPNLDEFVWVGHNTPLTLYRFLSPNDFLPPGWYPFLSYPLLTGYKVVPSPQYGVFALLGSQGVVLVRGFQVDVIDRFSCLGDVAFSADGSVLATVRCFDSISLWRVSDLTHLGTYNPPFPVKSLLFTPSGELLLGGTEGQLARWNWQNNTMIRVNAPLNQQVEQIVLAPTGDLFATVIDNRVFFWRTQTLELLGELIRPDHVESIRWAKFDPARPYLYTSGNRGHVDRWSLSTLRHEGIVAREWRLKGFRAGTREVWLSVGEHDYTGRHTYVYDAEGRFIRTVPYVGQFSRDKKWVLTPQLELVRVSDGLVVASFCRGFRCGVISEFSYDSTLFFAIVFESGVSVPYMIMYNLQNLRPLWWEDVLINPIFISLKISKNNQIVLVSTLGYIELRNARRGNVIWRLDIPNPNKAAALSDDGGYLALAIQDENQTRLQIYSVSSRQLIYSEILPISNVRHVRYISGDRYLAVVAEGIVLFYRTSDWQKIYEEYFEDAILLGDTGRFIALPTQGMVYTHSLSGEMTWVARYELAPLKDAELSDDGTRLVLRYADNTIEVVRMRPVLGDLNYDGCVDDADLLEVLHFFGQNGALGGDVNGDLRVDDNDLLLVLFHFGNGC